MKSCIWDGIISSSGTGWDLSGSVEKHLEVLAGSKLPLSQQYALVALKVKTKV